MLFANKNWREGHHPSRGLVLVKREGLGLTGSGPRLTLKASFNVSIFAEDFVYEKLRRPKKI